MVANTSSRVANDISTSICVNSGWRSARRSSSRKHFTIWKYRSVPGDHQDLLEDLRRLRQRVELARVHAARHEVVARAFGRRLRQDRRFDLPEPLGVEVLPHRHRHPVAQAEVRLQRRPAQVEVAVLQPQFVGRGDVVRDDERRHLRLAQHLELGRRAPRSSPVGIFGFTASAARGRTRPLHADDELGAQVLGAVAQRLGRRRRPASGRSGRARRRRRGAPRSRTRCTQPSSSTVAPGVVARAARRTCACAPSRRVCPPRFATPARRPRGARQ